MKRVLIVGAGKGGSVLLNILRATKRMHIVAIVDKDIHAEGLSLARKFNISCDNDWKQWVDKDIDIIIEATGDDKVLDEIIETRSRKTVVIPGTVAYIIAELFNEKEELLKEIRLQMDNQNLILNNIRDGMIVVNHTGKVDFVNRSAQEIVGLHKDEFEGKQIREVIQNSRLPIILRNKRKEVNQKLVLENGKQIITTRIPIINADGNLQGAFAIFKDITEVVNLAEENTDLKEIKTMLEAIIQSSDEAISVVDENGLGLMINPAYTKITGLKESDIVGAPASVDISEGESMHMKVLQTRRAVRGVRMKVGPTNKDVYVNVAPIIVDGKIKGSVGVLHDVTEVRSLTSELKRARQIIRSLEAKYTFDDIIGGSSEMRLALEQAKVGAKTPATVLLRGKSGTGKELFAHAIHNESDRKHNKFIRVNCAAIAESILESELFGYEEGAFSGAKHGGKKGLFEEANFGSIFLDEIGELSLNMQAKLLRVLQENEIVRVGGTDPITLDVRVITATNVNLEKAIMNKTFREDLYYRLNRLPIFIPSLQERVSDLPELVHHIIVKTNQDYGKNVKSISNEALTELKKYNWPGNIRELENVIGRAMIYMDINEEVIQLEHLPELGVTTKVSNQPTVNDLTEAQSLQLAVERYERSYIAKIFEKNNFNKTKTAKELKISIRSLYYKLEKHQLE
ncbi:sigma-54-dependent Fis family transcriptional regulator [Virgibacillus halodenitrificans]|uniref:Sigma-54-dependent Fis family transcriptional regulator n=1 Tax=Virgibacillus halodenitrificans TaxID=1482 RepID=A0AAC9J042_VIRHA|nr:sigma 54-interacting transcriptional regulator [Virgibacillus halodenitrificans]APC48349.1 sigma-54-dependent Fis family transcriptional regulator [Virgibacillus halodenitrificans]MEC2158382.1 sigma 54-interacting transcriptional regulator [Virgibacillus halodenitrificans]